jgi:hypothetical protein
MSQAKATTDHNEIRRWVESRKGHPAFVKSTRNRGGEGSGLLRIDFEPDEQSLAAISWDEFFVTFEESNLAFLYQDRTASGRKSRFNKFVSRDTVAAPSGSEDAASGTGAQMAAGQSSGGKTQTGKSVSQADEDEIEELEEEEVEEEEGEDLDEDAEDDEDFDDDEDSDDDDEDEDDEDEEDDDEDAERR